MSNQQNTKTSLTCHVCGKLFFTTPYRISTGHGKFCSRGCSDKGRVKSKASPLKERFLSKVSVGIDGNCWGWLAGKNGDGYGVIQIGKRSKLAHRVSWELHYGAIPNDINVLHKCDNRCCTNPNHLFLGTQLDNIQDMKAKGRAKGPVGEDATFAKLTKQEVVEIRSKRTVDGITYTQLAQEYGVSSVAVRYVCNRKSWRHVK